MHNVLWMFTDSTLKCDTDYGFGLVWFYGISTIEGYLMPNPFYTHILNI